MAQALRYAPRPQDDIQTRTHKRRSRSPLPSQQTKAPRWVRRECQFQEDSKDCNNVERIAGAGGGQAIPPTAAAQRKSSIPTRILSSRLNSEEGSNTAGRTKDW